MKGKGTNEQLLSVASDRSFNLNGWCLLESYSC